MSPENILVLGIGNILYGDEGVGVAALRKLEEEWSPPDGVTLLDGGTGSFALLGPMQSADTVILIDATLDEKPPGSVTRLKPRFASDYPPTLTAHDIGLKDLLDAFYLSGNVPEVILFAVSIAQEGMSLGMELSARVGAQLPTICDLIINEVTGLTQTPEPV